VDPEQPTESRAVDRRTLLKGGLAAGGLLVGGLAIRALADPGEQPAPAPAPVTRGASERRPNILVILVDQMRFPQWLGASALGPALPPNLQRLRSGAVSFARHYSVSNDCTPSRAALVTGLYTHQTGCMITGGSTLDPGFPTWGTMLREHGYNTRWLGKWHLTHHDNHWTAANGEQALERYGFAGGVYPSPDGAPGQAARIDPKIAAEFERWFRAEGGGPPWCTTVSFVNPHDVAWWYVWSNRVRSETDSPRTARRLPPNFETPQELTEHSKPRLQRSLQDTAAASFGPVPFTGPGAEARWLGLLDLYAKLQREVDSHIGRVLATLESKPEIAANTVVVFTSDHGEYGASHGLRGKGAAAYEEGIRVPLIVKDPRGLLTRSPEQVRTQLTSSVDVAPLLLTIATGGEHWRTDRHYSQIAGRADLARILAEPGAPGRDHVLHATDEVVTEFAIEPYAADAPLHVVAVRTADAKYATYSHWPEEGIEPLAAGEEAELYDYRTHGGRLELDNTAGTSALESPMRAKLEHAFTSELREPLPSRLSEAHARGFADYFSTARGAAQAATLSRRKRSEREVGPIDGLEPRPVKGAANSKP
jgi:arylsulfatase A-like enzyme